MNKYLLYYLIAVNVMTFALYGIDKYKARHDRWRIPEKTLLLLLPVIGGSVGGILGMYIFRHKTKHWYFKFGLPVILAVQAALAILLPRVLAQE